MNMILSRHAQEQIQIRGLDDPRTLPLREAKGKVRDKIIAECPTHKFRTGYRYWRSHTRPYQIFITTPFRKNPTHEYVVTGFWLRQQKW